LTEGVADLPRWRQEVISPVLEKTRHLNRLRDLSRIFFESRMKALESALITHARELNLSPAESILFATPEEIRSRELLVSKLIERELEYESFSNWTLPSSLRDPKPRLLSWSLVTVSSGTSEGRLVSEAELLEILKSPQSSGTEDLILWTELLEPRLHHYFPHLQGILADRGGLLSHLAILARESRMPVWVNFRPSADFPLGSRIQVSNTGDVPVIRSASSRIRP
jgi:phosphohistidine swiveling domain-containing protein